MQVVYLEADSWQVEMKDKESETKEEEVTVSCVLLRSLLWTTGVEFCQNLSMSPRSIEKASLNCLLEGIGVKNVSTGSHLPLVENRSPITTSRLD